MHDFIMFTYAKIYISYAHLYLKIRLSTIFYFHIYLQVHLQLEIRSYGIIWWDFILEFNLKLYYLLIVKSVGEKKKNFATKQYFKDAYIESYKFSFPLHGYLINSVISFLFFFSFFYFIIHIYLIGSFSFLFFFIIHIYLIGWNSVPPPLLSKKKKINSHVSLSIFIF